jgi:GGDEF domain-containing protein
VAPLLAGLKAAPALLNPFTDDPVGDFAAIAGPAAEEYQKKIYTPHTKAGEQAGEILGLPAKAGKYLGEHAQDLGLPPSIAAALDVGTQILPFALGDKAIRGRGEVAPKVPDVAPDVTEAKQDTTIPLSPDARHLQLQDQHGLTPEQKAAFPLPKDPLTGYDTKAQLDPTIEAAKQSGEPSTYVELDLKNLGGLNKHAGSISAADEHVKAMTSIAKQELDSVGEVVPFKKGGDEFAFVVKGADPATTHDALAAAQEKVNAYAEENGLHQIENPKGGEPGTGIHFAATEIHPDRPISDTVKSAESLVEARKQGAPYERPDQEAGSRPLAEGATEGSPSEAASRTGTETPAAVATDATQRGSTAPDEVSAAPVERPGSASDSPVSGTAGEPRAAPPAEAAGRDSRVANAATYVDRATRGVEQLPEAEAKPWAQSKAEAANRITADPEYARNLAAEVAAKPRAISDVETMALGAERQKLHDQYHQTHDDILKAREAGDPISEAQALAKRTDIENQLDLNERAVKHAGTDLGRAMAARNALHAEDYTPARNITRAKVAFGDKFNEAIRKQVEDLSSRLAEAEAKIARQEANKPASDMRVTRADKRSLSPDERMQAQIEKKMAKLQEAIERRTKACPI